MLSVLRRNEDVFLCATGAELWNERKRFVKGDGGNKALHRNPKCINRIKIYIECRSKIELRVPDAFIQYLNLPWSADPFYCCKFHSFQPETYPTWQREQWQSTSNGVALL